MTFSVLAAFHFKILLPALIWLAFGVLNLWIWQKGKAQGNMLMMIGGFCLGGGYTISTFSKFPEEFVFFWIPTIGAALILAGFYLVSAKVIEAQMAGIKAKMQQLKEATSEKDDASDADAS